MRNLFLFFIFAFVSIVAFGSESSKKSCENIKAACKSAGFTKNGHKEMKGLDADCFKPILAGKNIVGVVINEAELNACKERISMRREKRHEVQAEAREKRLESNSSN